MNAHLDFTAWMHEVDILCIERLGLSIHDLRGYNPRELYEAGLSPCEVLDCEQVALERMIR